MERLQRLLKELVHIEERIGAWVDFVGFPQAGDLTELDKIQKQTEEVV